MGFRLTQGTTIEDVDGITVIIAENGDSAVLNGSAGTMVDALLECSAKGEAIERILSIYSVERAELIEDMQTVINDLKQHGMIEEVDS